MKCGESDEEKAEVQTFMGSRSPMKFGRCGGGRRSVPGAPARTQVLSPGFRCSLETLWHFCLLYSSVSCVIDLQKKQLQFHTVASSVYHSCNLQKNTKDSIAKESQENI